MDHEQLTVTVAESSRIANDLEPGRQTHRHPHPHFVARSPHGHGPAAAINTVATMVVVALFVLTFILQTFRIPSDSMERTLLVGDFLLVNKFVYAPSSSLRSLLPYQPVRRGDIVVFHYPVDSGKHLVKRIIGLPGDRLRLQQGLVTINGAPLLEPYTTFLASGRDPYRDDFPGQPRSDADFDPRINAAWWSELQRDVHNGELVVPPGHYFVMGDNRNDSLDSRYWGFVPAENIVGSPLLVYFSLRDPSTREVSVLPAGGRDDKLGHENTPLARLVGFARWDRMFHVVR